MIEFMRTTDVDLYTLFNIIALLLYFVYTFCHIKTVKTFPCRVTKKIIGFCESKNSKIPISTIVAIVEMTLYVFVNYFMALYYIKWFAKPFGMEANYFGVVFIGPVIFAALSLLLGIDIVKVYDIQAPAFALALFISKFGCFCAGCCHGIEWEKGLYNYSTGLVEFPVQLVETGIALCIFVFLVLIRKKAKPGTLFPTYLILYSSTRFCSEFLRHEPDVLGKLKVYHLLCLAGIVVGFIWMIMALCSADRITVFFTREYNIIGRVRSISGDIGFYYHQTKKRVTKKDDKVVYHKKKRKKK